MSWQEKCLLILSDIGSTLSIQQTIQKSRTNRAIFLTVFNRIVGDYMVALEVGRIAVKIAGREAKRKCVIVQIKDRNFVVVTGPQNLTGVRRRRANIDHLLLTDKKIEIPENADDETVLAAIEKAGLKDYMTTPNM